MTAGVLVVIAVVAPASTAAGGSGSTKDQTFAAGLGNNPDPIGSMYDLWPIRNGWAVSDHRRLTIVQAGGNIDDKAEGRILVFRYDYVKVEQTFDLIAVEGTGPLKLTDGPEGRGPVQTWSQRHGKLRFSGSRGQTGTFFLKDDRIEFDPMDSWRERAGEQGRGG